MKLGILAVLFAVGTAQAGTVYQVDHGTADGAVGAPGLTLITLNHFTIVPGANALTTIQGLFGNACGCITDGTPVTAYLWSDPNQDGSPWDAQVLASATGVIHTSDIGQFIDFPITPQTLPDGTSFFAGFGYPTGIWASFDSTAPAGQSWLAQFIGPSNPNNLPGAFQLLPYSANFLVRVESGSAAVPEPSTWLLLLTGIGVTRFSRRLRYLR